MAISRLGGITGTKKISEDFENINVAFNNTVTELDEIKNIGEDAQNDINEHKASTEAHTSENITYTGKATGTNVKDGLDGLSDRVDNLILESGDSSPEVVDARGTYTVLRDRLNASDSKLVVLETEITDLAYINADERNILTVAKVGGQFTTINDAIDYAKIYCSPTNRVAIFIAPGTYAEEIILYPNPGINLIGSGSTSTIVQYPSVYPNSPIYTMGSGHFLDIGFVSSAGGNNSYALHSESQIDPAQGTIVFDRCAFFSYNNAGVGLGLGQDTTIQFNSCVIGSSGYSAIYCHNSPANNTSNQLLELTGCQISSYGFDKCLVIDDAAKMQGNSNSVIHVSFANCQSINPNIMYRVDPSTTLSHLPKTDSDIVVKANSKNTNILGCDYDLREFVVGGLIIVGSSGLFTITSQNSPRYNYQILSAVDKNGSSVLSTVNFVGTSDNYLIFTTTAPSVLDDVININVLATAK